MNSSISVAGLIETCSVAGNGPKDSCGWAYHPRASSSSHTVNTSTSASPARATRLASGAVSTRRWSNSVLTASTSSRCPSRTRRASAR